MKHFRLAGLGYRKNTDLTVYEEDIENAVRIVKPEAEVDVHKTYFTTLPELTKSESIAVSTILRSDSMYDLTVYRPCLLISTQYKTKAEKVEMEEAENVISNINNTRLPEKKMGGRVRDSKRVPSNKQKGNKKARKGQS